MREWPLRWKLTLHTAALAGLVLTLFGVGVSWHLYHDGIAELDRDTTEVARLFLAQLDKRNHVIDWSNESAVDELFPTIRQLYFIEILDHGKSVFRSPNLRTAEFPMVPEGSTLYNAQLRGRDVRAGIFADRKGTTLRLAVSKHHVDESRADLLEAFLFAGPVAILLVAGVGWWIARRALLPVERLAAAAARISAHRLDQRLPIPEAHDEIGQLTETLNEMIDRLDTSFQQATRFSADASHELKTPLTVLRGELEEALRAPDLAPAQERLLLDLLEETHRLIAITEGLLLLSRADAGRLQIERERVDLDALLDDLIEDAEILASPRGIRLDAENPRGLQVLAHVQFLRQVLLNLFDNAVKYNKDGGIIEIRVIPGAERHTITVANTGATLTDDEAARVFDRFYRADQARDRSIGGHGLGLSICREIVRALDSEIAVVTRTEPGYRSGWTEFRLGLNASRGTSAPLSTRGETRAVPRHATAA